jgi:protein-disulfide isomerase
MSRLVQAVGPADHVLGTDAATVTLVEYGDYECTFCGRAHGVLAQVLEHVGGEARFVYRHFPLSQLHRRARPAAQAAEAAAAQGRFWDMHHTLYEHQDALETEDLFEYADALGLDLVRFAHELREKVHLARVRADFLSGVRSGVNGTPTFFINGERFDLPWDDPATLETAIEQAA